MKKIKVVVTGGAGFMGSHLVDRLIKRDRDVLVIDDLSGGYKENINSKAGFIKYDLRNYNPNKKSRIEDILKRFKPEVIFHLAANAAENKAQFSPIDITSRNFASSINMMTLGLRSGMRRFIYTSSIAVYGALQTPFKENDKPEPEDLYGISKVAIENSIKILSKVHGFEYVIVRPHNVYGPRQNMKDPYRNVVTIFMNSLMQGKPYNIYGNGKQKRCFSYIDDVIDTLFKCSYKNVSGRIFNIGSDKAHTINELSDVIQKISGINISPVYLNERPQEVKVAIADHTQAKKHLKHKDRTTFSEGIKKTWKYVKSIGPQKVKYGKVELHNDKMPSNWKSKR